MHVHDCDKCMCPVATVTLKKEKDKRAAVAFHKTVSALYKDEDW